MTILSEVEHNCENHLGKRCGGREGTTDGCCTKENPCVQGDGDCDVDQDCSGDLVCGMNNCGGFPFPSTHDCCMKVLPGKAFMHVSGSN